jgi:hypothetical protein
MQQCGNSLGQEKHNDGEGNGEGYPIPIEADDNDVRAHPGRLAILTLPLSRFRARASSIFRSLRFGDIHEGDPLSNTNADFLTLKAAANLNGTDAKVAQADRPIRKESNIGLTAGAHPRQSKGPIANLMSRIWMYHAVHPPRVESMRPGCGVFAAPHLERCGLLVAGRVMHPSRFPRSHSAGIFIV